VVLGLVGQGADEDLPQPGGQLGLGRAEELAELPGGLEERLLDEVGGIEPDPQRLADQRAGDQPQVVAIELQEPAQRGGVAGAGLLQEQLGDGING
jgi:hypothetical protein